MDTVSAESGSRLSVAAYCVHTSLPYWSLVFHNRWLLAEMSRIAADVIQEICRQADVVPGIFTVIHTWGHDQQWHPHIHLSTTAGGVTPDHTWKNLHFYARKVMSMWRYRITVSGSPEPY